MGKKNLEQLFKETLKDFQEVPDERVWQSIEASLDKKKQKKRIIPIWWRLGGVAALLAILFYVINPFGTEPIDEEIIVTEVENNDNRAEDNNSKAIDDDPSILNDSERVVNSSDDTQIRTSEDSDGVINNHQSQQKTQQLVTNGNEQKENHANPNKTDIPNNQTDETNVALAQVENAVAQDNGVASEISQQRNPEQSLLDNMVREEKEVIADVKINLKEEKSQKDLIAEELQKQQKENEAIAKTDEEENQNETKSIFDAIKEQEEAEIEVAENTNRKWSVGPSVAPVYFNATGDGSPIHSNFAPNSKSGNVNLSYGLTVAYDLGKRLKVRSGVHKVKYGYDTNDVVFSSSSQASSNDLIDNISYTQTSRTLVVESKNQVAGKPLSDASIEVASFNEAPALEGKMVQQLGYIEVPLELNYKLLDKKFGVDLIGGVSSLFLVDNSVLVESDELITEVGEANNANSLNFSTNVGVGLNYKFAPKAQLSLEPMFKYQMNTFSETSGSFRPFSVGVYSGISFKF